ncbi:hypothetical protein JTB14_019479 [Gonioctena quinquepunctata]|nr:hypothetical protein JTB14_019479 [Gonioctena quinquepunctata]
MTVIKFCSVFLVASLVHASSIHVDKMEMCDPTADYPVKWMMKLKDENGRQIVEEGSLISRVDLDNNVLGTLKVYTLVDNEWNHLISKEDPICSIKEQYMGEVATQLEKAAGVTQTCPYSKGTYKISNYPIDWSKLKYQDFPEGKIKIIGEFNNAKTKEFLGCVETIITWKP